MDNLYQIFINYAKMIFDQMNDLENGECNPDNKLLYYETSDCDSKLNIEKAHGGYICGEDKKWDTNNCIASYCDIGYILNDDKTKCIPDPCENIILKEISINNDKDIDFTIEPNNSYIFTIDKENTSYYFISDHELLFYTMNQTNHIMESVKNGIEFKYKDKIYANYYVNISKSINISIKINNNPSDDSKGDNGGLSGGIIALIIIGSVVLLLFILLIIICICKKKKVSNLEIEDRSELLNTQE